MEETRRGFCQRGGSRIKKIAPRFIEIANNNQFFHEGAHRSAPEEFNPVANYMQHIHIASNSLVKRDKLPTFLYALVQLGYLPEDEVGAVCNWAADLLDGEEVESDSGAESVSRSGSPSVSPRGSPSVSRSGSRSISRSGSGSDG
jgi:hypothetical protein